MPENEVPLLPQLAPGPAVSDLRSHLRRRNDPRFRIFVIFVLVVLGDRGHLSVALLQRATNPPMTRRSTAT